MRLGRIILIALLALAPLLAATFRLYLKDGSFQRVREYKVDGDRVSYYSTERATWEELPLDLVDLPRTDKEAKGKEESLKEITRKLDEEEKADKQARSEVTAIPYDAGLYRLVNNEPQVLEQSDISTRVDKGRRALGLIVPVPVVQGKQAIEIPGVTAKLKIEGSGPEFYLRFTDPRVVSIVKLKPKKTSRLVDTWTIEPLTKTITNQELDEVPVFRQQLSDGLLKIWSLKPLPTGEYAVVEYVEGEPEIRIWDFSIHSDAPPLPVEPKPTDDRKSKKQKSDKK